jgi:hypothetical protein
LAVDNSGTKDVLGKGSFGTATEWIGAQFTVDNLGNTVELSLPSDMISEWKPLATSRVMARLVKEKLVPKFAGKMNWAGGIAVQLTHFTRMLYAALESKGLAERAETVWFTASSWHSQ